MRVTFESGAWVEMRAPGELNAKDKAKMLAATILPSIDVNGTGMSSPLSMDMLMRQTYAVMDRIITGWSYDWVLPKDDISQDEDGYRTWDASLLQIGIDDWNELEEAVEPHMVKMRGGPKGKKATTSSSNGFSKGAVTNSRKGSPKTA
jgi:hypothetical protein